MIILNGKYNFAKVMLPNDRVYNENTYTMDGRPYIYLDDATKGQIESFLNHPAFRGRKIVIMPDTHFGKGSCVGFTMDLGDYVIPNIVGVDIGCGIMTTKLPINIMNNKDLRDFDEFVKSEIPAGFKIHPKPLEWYFDEISLYQFCIDHDIDFQKSLNSVGTLGGGNHFIELGMDGGGGYWLTIHSGSRNLGLKVANFYQKIADETCAQYFQNFGDLNFLIGKVKNDYLNAMALAQHYANINRRTMTRIIMDGFFGIVNFEEQIDSVHNYIDFNDNIIRKGATPAHEGQKLVIPFNMEDGLIIGRGKGNKDWNYSAPHGAGRILSRKKAKETLDLEVAKRGMESSGIYTTSLSLDTLDEAKLAYKPMDLIINAIKDTVEIDHVVRPIYNFKAGGD